MHDDYIVFIYSIKIWFDLVYISGKCHPFRTKTCDFVQTFSHAIWHITPTWFRGLSLKNHFDENNRQSARERKRNYHPTDISQLIVCIAKKNCVQNLGKPDTLIKLKTIATSSTWLSDFLWPEELHNCV